MNSEKMASFGRLLGAETPDWLQVPPTAQPKLVRLVTTEDFGPARPQPSLEVRRQLVDVSVCV